MALGVAIAGACATYTVGSIFLYDGNAARFFDVVGYKLQQRVTLSLWDSLYWVRVSPYWVRLYAFCLEIGAAAALGVYAYARLQSLSRTARPPAQSAS